MKKTVELMKTMGTKVYEGIGKSDNFVLQEIGPENHKGRTGTRKSRKIGKLMTEGQIQLLLIRSKGIGRQLRLSDGTDTVCKTNGRAY